MSRCLVKTVSAELLFILMMLHLCQRIVHLYSYPASYTDAADEFTLIWGRRNDVYNAYIEMLQIVGCYPRYVVLVAYYGQQPQQRNCFRID